MVFDQLVFDQLVFDQLVFDQLVFDQLVFDRRYETTRSARCCAPPCAISERAAVRNKRARGAVRSLWQPCATSEAQQRAIALDSVQ